MKKLTYTLSLLFFSLFAFFNTIKSQDINSLLLKAVKINDITKAKSLIISGANINATDADSASILMWAVYNGDLQLVKYLVEEGANYKYKSGVIYTNYNRTNYYGNIIGIAAGENKLDILKYLLEELKINIEDIEYNPETKKADGWNALQWAASKGHFRIVEYLLDNGADVNVKDKHGITPFFYACKNENSFEIAKYLLEKGANINATDADSASVLMWTAYKGDLQLIKYLIKNGANYKYKAGVIYTNEKRTNYYGNLIGIAAGENKLELLKFFVEDLNIDIEDIEYNPETKKADGWNALQWAASKGHTKIAEYLLNNGADINANPGSSGSTALMYAVSSKKTDIINLLIENGADIKKRNNDGWSILHYAAMYYSYRKDILELLLKKDLDINAQATGGGAEGWTPLMFAAINGKMSAFETLLDAGADINIKNTEGKTVWEISNSRGATVLHYAARDGKLEIVKLLIKKGANINAQATSGSIKGWTPIMLAIYNKQISIFETLLDASADINLKNGKGKSALEILINKENITILHYTCKNEHNLKFIKLLIEKGADVNVKDKDGKTPLFYACKNKNGFEIAKLLIEKGADINIKGGYDEETLIKYALENENGSKIVKLLIEKGADVNVKYDYDKKTLLHTACKNKNGFENVKYLIEKGADVNVKDKDGKTSLFYACKNKNGFEIAKYLIQKGADVNVKDKDNNTLLMYASYYADVNFVKLLVSKGADYKNVSVFYPESWNKDTFYGNLISITINENKLDILKYFIEELKININETEYNPKTKKNDGWNALQSAVLKENIKLINYLIDKGADINASEGGDGSSSLMIALKLKRYDIAELFLKKNANLNILNNEGWSALNYVLKNKNLELAKLFINKGADVSTKLSEGNNLYGEYFPLLFAMEYEEYDFAKILIEKGADVNMKNSSGYTALIYALENRKFKIAELLLNKGADVSIKNKFGNTALIIASKNNADLNLIKLFVKNGADINSIGNSGYTAFHYSIINKNDKLLKYLISKNYNTKLNISIYDAENPGYTPLHLAAKYNNLLAAILLIDNNINKEKQNIEGLTAIEVANNYNNKDIFEYLQNNKKNIFHYYIINDFTNFKKTLIQTPELINLKNSFGNTVWHLAIYDNNTEIINFLCTNKIGLNVSDQLGRTPFLYAVELNNNYATDLLLKNGADVDIADNNGHTAFFIAVARNQKGLIKLLIEHNAKKEFHLKSNLKLLKGHLQAVNSIVFSKNGKYFLSGGDDKKILLWETNTGKIIRTFNGHKGQIKDIVFCHDEQTFISAGGDKYDNFAELYLWDINTGNILRKFEGHNDIVNTIALKPNSQLFASAGNDSKIIIWNINTGKKIFTLTKHNGYINSLIFNKSGSLMYSGGGSFGKFSNNGELFVWETKKYRRTQIINKNNTQVIKTIALNKNGKIIAYGGFDNSVDIRNIKADKQIFEIKNLNSDINSVKFGINYDNIYITTNAFNYKVYNLQGKLLNRIEAHTNSINDLIISPDGNNILTASKDGNIKLWNLTNYIEINKYGTNSEKLKKITINPGNNTILAIYNNRTAKIKNINTWSTIKKINLFDINSIAITSDCEDVYYNDNNSYKRISIVNDEKIKENFSGNIFKYNIKEDSVYIISGFHTKPVNTISISNSKMLTSTKENIFFFPDLQYTGNLLDFSEVFFWDIKNDNIVHKYKTDTEYFKTYYTKYNKQNTETSYNLDINISEDENHFVSTDRNSQICFWDLSKDDVKNYINIKNISTYDLNTEGSQIIVAHDKNKLSLYETETGEKLSSFVGHKTWIRTVAFSSDGSQILSGSEDNTVKLWKTDGTVIHTFYGHKTPVISVQFYDNNKKAISVSEDEHIKIWDLNSKQELGGLYPLGENEIAVITPSGLFDASSEAMKKMYYVQGTETIELNQLKDRYYEPGLLKKIMTNEDLRDVQGFNDIKLPPQIELSPVMIAGANGRGAKPITGDEENLSGAFFTAKIKNNFSGGIGKVKVYVNGKEIIEDARLFSDLYSKGDNLKIIQNKDSIQITISLDAYSRYFLPNEENIISVKAYNGENYIISRPEVLKYTPSKKDKKDIQIPDVYILSIGTSEFYNSDINLRFAAKDAKDIATGLQIAANRLFGKEKVHTYLFTSPVSKDENMNNEEVSINTINTVFKSIASEVTADDIVIVYLAGHGMNINTQGDGGDFYYLTEDAHSTQASAYSDPAIREKELLSSNDLIAILNKLPANKQVLIIDACHSGKAVENLMVKRDMSSSTIRALDRMRDRTGMHIITGSTADAVSYESSRYGQGILTYSLLEGLKGASLKEGKFVDVMKWFQTAKERVPVLASDFGGIQEPVVFSPYVEGKYDNGAESFEIGELNNKDKELVPLAKSKPVFVFSLFQDEETFDDYLDLSENIDEKLRELTAKGSNAPLILIETKKFPSAYKIRGRYKVTGENINLKINLFKDKEKINSFEFSGNKNKIDEINQKIIDAVLLMKI